MKSPEKDINRELSFYKGKQFNNNTNEIKLKVTSKALYQQILLWRY